jgi:gluconate 2-dehydrogenase gamma chain
VQTRSIHNQIAAGWFKDKRPLVTGDNGENNMVDDASTRRSFLAEAGKLAGAGWLSLNAPVLLAAGEAAARQQAAGKNWVNLSAAEARGFGAVADQIIPPDDMPGASDAGVVYFIDNALGGFAAGMSGMLKSGLQALDGQTLAEFGEADGFAALPFDRQTGIIRTVEDSPFFQSMIFLTHCGMFAMPSWGGNLDKAGWALLGFENLHAWQPPFGYYDAEAREQGESS